MKEFTTAGQIYAALVNSAIVLTSSLKPNIDVYIEGSTLIRNTIISNSFKKTLKSLGYRNITYKKKTSTLGASFINDKLQITLN